MKKFLSLIMLLNTSLAFAHGGGDRVGNGGDVIVCPEKKTELLDIYQGAEDWGFLSIRAGSHRSVIIEETMADLRPVDPFIANFFQKRAQELDREIKLLEEDPKYRSNLVKLTKNVLVNITDEGVAELPADCKIIQAATQIQNPFPQEVKFTFQKNIWASLDPDVQASLILHEVIYEHMIKVGESSSRSTRYFNAALHAGAINTVKDYFAVSSIFDFRNLDIADDGKTRNFGATNNCSVIRKWNTHSETGQYTGTTVIVNRRNVIQHEPQFHKVMDLFWRKYAANGLCD